MKIVSPLMKLHPILLALWIAPLAATHAADAPAQKPNIVFILTDDQPLRAMGHVDPWFHTPHMDRLADEGVEFTNGFVECSVCCVSRASIMMGQFNSRHRIQSFDDPLSAAQLEQSFPVLLRKAGYRTALLGKYGVGHPRAAPKDLCLPAAYFDLWYGFPQSPSYAQTEDGEKRYITRVIEDKAIRFMKETPEHQPFLLYLCLPEPHGQGGPGGPWNYRDPEFNLPSPATPPPGVETMTGEAYRLLPEAIRKSMNAKIVGMPPETYTKYMATVRDYTARADLAIGRIREALKENGRADNTLIVLTSDNGSMWGAHGISGKWNMYEESIRVPMIIHDPRLPESTRGTKREQMALNIDLTATVLDYAGVPKPAAVQGMSLRPLLQDPAAKGRADWYYHHDVFTSSKGAPLPRCEGVRTERWKYIRYKDTEPVQEELFDLKTDPLEKSNLVGDLAQKENLAYLRALCSKYREQLK